jgi:hypothetical protein
MRRRSTTLLGGMVAVMLALPPEGPAAQGVGFNFDTGNAPAELIIPRAIPAILQSVSPLANDPPVILRITALTTTGWFDAIAPYHPNAIGVYSRIAKRPPHEATNRNRNIAILYASLRILSSVLPQHTDTWRSMLSAVGLDPDDTSENVATPAGLGNRAGNAVLAARLHDGMNQLGDEGGRRYNRQPYADYLGYRPVNTAYDLQDPSRWQPNVTTTGNGIFQVQQFVMAQWGVTTPYSYRSPDGFQVPPPHASNHQNLGAYRAQADEVLAASAGLTDHQKAAAEFFDNKFASLFASVGFLAQTRFVGLEEFVQLEFLTNVAVFDAGIATWRKKLDFDAVRPFSAIRYLYGNRRITAWGGPGQGTVRNMQGSEWRSYLNTANHPEYPSATAALCGAHAQVLRRFYGTDDLGFAVQVPRGSSIVEPGMTPATDMVLSYPTWTDFEQECGLSRFWGGVHFMPAVTEGQELGKQVGDGVYEFVRRRIDGGQ